VPACAVAQGIGNVLLYVMLLATGTS
jgi:hypothetical protein